MKLPTLKPVVGAFRVLHRRMTELGVPSLNVWADAGERAARMAGCTTVHLAHANECTLRELRTALARILSDGRVTPPEIKELEKLGTQIEQCAERSHDITEIAAT